MFISKRTVPVMLHLGPMPPLLLSFPPYIATAGAAVSSIIKNISAATGADAVATAVAIAASLSNTWFPFVYPATGTPDTAVEPTAASISATSAEATACLRCIRPPNKPSYSLHPSQIIRSGSSAIPAKQAPQSSMLLRHRPTH
jgi:hypothetical protein